MVKNRESPQADGPAQRPPSGTRGPRTWLALVWQHDQYAVALVLILISIVLTALAGDVGVARLAWIAMLGIALLYTLWTSGAPARSLVLAIVLLAAGLPAQLGIGLLGSESLARAIGYGLAILLVGLTVSDVARRLIRHPTVNARTMSGAVCVYLLIGKFFAATFGFLSTVDSGHFFTSTNTPHAVDYVYFSFSTLATLGYGDLVTRNALGRMLAVSEALIGQIYLVTVVAVIVANIGRSPRGQRR